MKKITEDAVYAFVNGFPFKRSNTEIRVRMEQESPENSPSKCVYFYLHGNLIAKRIGFALWVTNAGWPTNVTKERLNGIPEVSIYQKNGEWFLNDEPWSGCWREI